MVQSLTALMINTAAIASKQGSTQPTEEEKWLGLELLWRAACLEPKIDEATALCALDVLAHLLAKAFCAPVLPTYLSKCVENVRSGTLVARSLKLLQFVVDKQEDASYSAGVSATAAS